MLSTDPMPETPVVLKERRPFSLLLTCVKRDDKTRLDLTGCSLRLVIADPKRKGGDVKVTTTATLVDALLGVARFDIQGDELNFGAGTYLMAVTLVSAEGFESTIIEGPVELTYNPDPLIPVDSGSVVPPLSMTALFRDQNRVTVRVHHTPDSVLLDILEQAQQASDAAALAQAAADAAAAASAAQAAAAAAAQAAADAAAAAAGGSADDVAALVAQAQAAASDAMNAALEATSSANAAETWASSANNDAVTAVFASGDAQFFASNAQTYANQASSYSTDSYNHAMSSYGYAQDALNTLSAAILSDDIDTARVMTQAAYNALGSKDARTLYVIVG